MMSNMLAGASNVNALCTHDTVASHFASALPYHPAGQDTREADEYVGAAAEHLDESLP